MTKKQIPVVMLPGAEGWANAYQWAGELEEAFPGQDAHDFSYAIEYNDRGPIDDHTGIRGFTCWNYGERDGDHWQWSIVFENGEHWIATGGCDYTGWDCQSSLYWELGDVSDEEFNKAATKLVEIRKDLKG